MQPRLAFWCQSEGYREQHGTHDFNGALRRMCCRRPLASPDPAPRVHPASPLPSPAGCGDGSRVPLPQQAQNVPPRSPCVAAPPSWPACAGTRLAAGPPHQTAPATHGASTTQPVRSSSMRTGSKRCRWSGDGALALGHIRHTRAQTTMHATSEAHTPRSIGAAALAAGLTCCGRRKPLCGAGGWKCPPLGAAASVKMGP